MTSERPAWNAWDVPFFGATRSATSPRPPAVVGFAGDGNRAAERVWAILIAVGGIVVGAAATGLLLVASFVLSFGSEPSGAEKAFAFGLGGAIAVWGLVLAVHTYRHAGVGSELRISDDVVEIGYRTFRRSLVVPRDAVRAVAIDDTPVILFTKNRRFPISGGLPDDVFADALDNMPRLPWDDLDRGGPSPNFPRAGVIMEDFGNDASGYRHDEPELAGWASAGSAPRWIREGYLWSGDGSSLPFLRVGPGDVPNVALLFEGRVPTPRPPWWYFLSPLSGRSPMFVGGRAVGGVLVRLRDPQAAASAFEEWGVVRRITAEDVLEKGLLVAKPLRGWRIVAYAVLFLGPVLVDLVLRRW